MTCPGPETLAAFALDDGSPAVTRHVAMCEACRTDVARLREASAFMRSQQALDSHATTADCLDEMTIADVVDGRLSAESNPHVVTHLLECARCRAAVRATSALIADAAFVMQPGDPRAAEAPLIRRAWYLPLAAAAVLIVFLLPGGPAARTPGALREPGSLGAIAPRPVEPRAAVSQVDQLTWTRLPGAQRYRVRLYSTDGSIVWSRETFDTSMVFPRELLVPGAPSAYLWRVEAETEFRRWVQSDLVEFTIAPRR